MNEYFNCNEKRQFIKYIHSIVVVAIRAVTE